ncbi:GTSE1 protein, partial [Thalassarche chlororhynchos]|nr:GTSE1 protein [Thalassarche chlororhynchos]
MEEGKEMAAHCSSHVIEEKLGICMSNVSDFHLLTDETFDFDLSLSPASGNEDEVFVGPLGHKEKCIAVNIEAKKSAEKKSAPTSDDKLMWSPLTGEKFVEIFKEARLLALQIETESKNEQTKISQSEERENKIIEKFVEDPKSKLKILRNQNVEKSPRAVKRETYCVRDSPACQLPPCFQKESDKLLSDDKTHAFHTPPDRNPVKIHASPTKIASSPLTQEQKTKERNTKATGKLPIAKPSSTLGKSNLLTIEKPKPGKHTSISTKRDLNSMGSSEDLISDKSSAASDVFESSFSGSSSAQDKKALPAPSKPGLKKITHLKLPGVASGLTRKTTSSSSSSSLSSMNSSLNSSLPISPIGKNGKSNMSSKASVSGSKLSSSTNRLALVRPTRVSSLQAANTEKSTKQARSASTPKISSAVSLAKSSASATSSEAVGSGIQRLSSVLSLQKLCQQNKDGSATKGSLCPKPKARVSSIPTSQTKVPAKTGDTPPNKSAPKATPSLGLTFCGTLGSAMAVSTPVKASEDGIFQNSYFPERSVSMTPASLKRSCLPTPIRRISGLPAVTPKTAPRMAFSPRAASVCQSSSFSTKKTLTAGSKQTKESKTQISSSEDDISPPPVLPLALNFSPEKTAAEVVENELKEAEVQNQLAEEKQTEALLVDIGVDKSLPHTLECESRPLIDLSNTPEVNKITPLKPTFSGQVKLIDLSSPLITLSPDVNKENLDSPLLKF